MLLCLAGCEQLDSHEPAAPARAVVVPEHPLALVNTQQDALTWPLWGGAFEIGELSIRASLEATGHSGLRIAGPELTENGAAIELVSAADGEWTLRETVGGGVVQEQSGTIAGELVIELTPTEVRVGELALELAAPLGPLGGDAGLYVTLAPGASLVIDELTLSDPLPARPELGPPLRELAAAHDLDIGTALDIWPPLHSLALESLLGEQFNRVAPTDLYWPTTRGEDQDFFFVPADLAVNYALVHGQSITGMFLIWDFALPEWVIELHESGDAIALEQVFDEHITTTVERYAGRVDTWVVVNEAIWGAADVGEPADFAQTLWFDALGPEYIERAFEVARAADPEAVLIYNETGAELVNDKS
ncbi:MAG TPA: endo-1,4-beta-xylanase, partial [Enhygromyxa sp.]|nr:endo-1,4-beta-xylanase [Enhygromyxa sp.]